MFNLDFIGDVHGKGTQLERLLAKLGYRETFGVWRKAGHLAVFVGDLLDRGTEQLKTVNIVRRMVEAGTAVCVLGNHEHNAIGWMTPDPLTPGEYCRPRKDANRRQHIDFLREVEHDPQLHAEVIAWLSTLPPVLEIQGIRVAHACWDDRHVATVQAACRPDGSLTEEGLLASLTKGTAVHAAMEVITRGPEARLPEGSSYVDAVVGKTRNQVRIAWWSDAASLREAALPMPGIERHQLPAVPVALDDRPQVPTGRLHFFGHYWMSGDPRPLAPHLASVDYSGTPGLPLTAYCWQGERTLQHEHFVQVF